MAFKPQTVPVKSNVHPFPKGGKAKRGGAKEKGPTPEFIFSQAMAEGDDQFRLGAVENIYGTPDTNFYRWMDNESGARWQLLLDAHMRGWTQDWLRNNLCEDLSQSRISSCLTVWRDMMVYQRQTVPRLQERCDVVPLRNAYLLIGEDGVIRAVKPNPMYGQTYNVQADLDWSRVDEDGVYTPSTPKEGSYWHTYLNATFPDRAVFEIAQEAFSMALLSKCYEKAVWLYGTGANGKSVMLHILRSLCPVATQSLQLPRLVKNEFGTSSLIAKKIAIVTEMPKVLTGEIQGLLKALVSRDPTPAEFKGRDQFDFIPTAAWFMASNHHPIMPEHEHGWWRKVITLPFLNRIEKDDRIVNLERLITEDPAEMIQVIDWLLIGGARLTKRGRFKEGDELPGAITDLAHTQRMNSDPVAAWIEDAQPEVSGLVLTSKKAIYQNFREHVLDSGRQPCSSPAFWLRMAEYFRSDNLETKGQQLTLLGVRDRYVELSVADVKPGRVLLDAARPEKIFEPVKASDEPFENDWKDNP